MIVTQATESLKVQLAAAQDEIGCLHSQLAEAQRLSQSQQQQVTASNEDLVSSQKQVAQLTAQQRKVSAGDDETAALRAQLEEMQAAPPLKRTPLKRTPLGQLQADLLTPKLLHPVSSLRLQNVLWCSCLFQCKSD